jgi:hypothetical protein
VATLYVEEYAGTASVGSNTGQSRVTAQAAQEPSLASQIVAITGSSTQSGPFTVNTTFVRLHTDAICSVAFGPNPTAVTTQKRMIAGQTEYFGVRPNDLVAVIVNV